MYYIYIYICLHMYSLIHCHLGSLSGVGACFAGRFSTNQGLLFHEAKQIRALSGAGQDV